MKDSIYYYFKVQLDRAPDDTTLKDVSVESTCGEDCRGAIDAGKQLIHYSRLAGTGSLTEEAIVDHIEDIITTFWRG